MDCVFCKIASGQIPTDKIYEDDELIAFYDLDPQAPIHFLVIPKKHISSNADLSKEDSHLIGKIFLTIKKITEDLGISKEGYRIVNNTGEKGGQTVCHMHFHVLAGRDLKWPPG